MLAPYKGRVYDPCCGSGGMFVQSEKFVEAHGGRIGDIAIYGQESNPTTWRLAKMNLAIRGIDGDLGPEHADSFHRDLHPDLKADYVLANPPFNDSATGAATAEDDVRWKYGMPPDGQRQLRLGAALHPPPGPDRHRRLRAGQRLACRPTSRARAKSARPSSRPIWSIAWSPCPASSSTPRRFPSASGSWPAARRTASFRDRRGETLFIDARKLGTLIDRVHRELTDEDIARHRRHLPRLARRQGLQEEVRGHSRLLQVGHDRGDPPARPRPDAGPLRRGRGSRGRRRTV